MGAQVMDFFILYSRYLGAPFFSAYTFLVLLLLCCSGLPFKKIKHEAFNWLFVINTVLPWFYLAGLLYQVWELYTAWYGQNPYELHAFFDNGSAVSFQLFYVMAFVVPLISLLFFAARFRTNRVFISLFLLLFNAGAIMAFIFKYDKDYLPSSWQLQQHSITEQFLKWMLLPLLLFIIYFFLYKRNRLPHPSLFLKRDVQSG